MMLTIILVRLSMMIFLTIFANRNTPTFLPLAGQINADLPAIQVCCGSSHSLVVTSSGALYTFGSNGLGQLGLGSVSDQLSPARVDAFFRENIKIKEVAAGSYHSVALTVKGAIYSFGHSEYGQHGVVDVTGRDLRYKDLTNYFFTPRIVHPFNPPEEGAVTIVSVKCGTQYGIALDNEGGVWTWGWNAHGVLGRNRAISNHPQRVDFLLGHSVKYIEAGHDHVMVGVKPLGDSFALSYSSIFQTIKTQPSNNESSAIDPTQDLTIAIPKRKWEISSTDKGEDTIDKTANKVEEFAETQAHSLIIFGRCPSMKNYIVKSKSTMQSTQHQIRVELRLDNILSIEMLVLKALLEYLYTDQIRSCPPHRYLQLGELGLALGLPRLHALCKHAQAQKRFTSALYGSASAMAMHLHSKASTSASASVIAESTSLADDVPPSTFTADMVKMVDSKEYADISFTVPDEVESASNQAENMYLPLGHTEFSWTSQPLDGESMLGHTQFSANSTHMSSAHNVMTKFFANKCVLMRYDYFNHLMGDKFREGSLSDENHPISLNGIDKEAMIGLLHWVYAGDRSAINIDNVFSLLDAARCFGVNDCKDYCEFWLRDNAENCSIDSIKTIVDFAKQNDLNRLLYRCECLLAFEQENNDVSSSI